MSVRRISLLAWNVAIGSTTKRSPGVPTLTEPASPR